MLNDGDEGDGGIAIGVEFDGLWRVAGGGPVGFGSNLPEKGDGPEGSFEGGWRLTRRVRGRVGEMRASLLEEDDAVTAGWDLGDGRA